MFSSSDRISRGNTNVQTKDEDDDGDKIMVPREEGTVKCAHI